MVTFLLQIYFTLEMKRVRIWLESKDPIELEVKLAAFTRLKYGLLGMVIVMWISGVVLYLAKGSEKDDDFNFAWVLSFGTIFAMIGCALLVVSIRQYFFFVRRRIAYRKERFESMDLFEKIAITWIYTVLLLFTLEMGLSITSLIVYIADYADD